MVHCDCTQIVWQRNETKVKVYIEIDKNIQESMYFIVLQYSTYIFSMYLRKIRSSSRRRIRAALLIVAAAVDFRYPLGIFLANNYAI